MVTPTVPDHTDRALAEGIASPQRLRSLMLGTQQTEYPMRYTLLTLIGASLATLPAVAASVQDEMPTEGAALSPEQQLVFDSWPPDQKLAYGTWPKETQTYFWTLSDKRQELFWRLKDEDKIALSSMPPGEQDAVWNQLEARAAAEEPSGQ